MKKNTLRAFTAVAFAIAALLAMPGAYAVTGDKVYGCDQGNGCETQMFTNKCSSGSTYWLGINTVADPTPNQYYNAGPYCTLRWRYRMENAAGNGWEVSPYASVTNNSSKRTGNVTTNIVIRTSKMCWIEYSVKRSDGTYYMVYHYSDRFRSSQLMREICTDA